jgi:hypothetical protein
MTTLEIIVDLAFGLIDNNKKKKRDVMSLF